MSPEVIDLLWKAGIGVVVMVVGYAIKDWRRARIENKLAEETRQPKARKVTIEALDSQILSMASAWDQERKSKDRVIAELETELADTKEQLQEARTEIQAQREDIDMLKREIRGLKSRIPHQREGIDEHT